MYIKIINPKKDGRKKYNNSASCTALVRYLSKEDEARGVNREFYFTNARDMVTGQQVIQTIDHNSPRINKGQARFFCLVIAPSADEMKHLNNDINEFKRYAVEVMDVYAQNFTGRKGNGKNLKGNDLVWFGKVEYNRYYEGSDPEVKAGRVRQGTPVPGNNTHIHIIVSRQDKTQTQKLSPLVNSKKLFHREGFKLKSCERFDNRYGYEGSGKDLEKLMIMRDGTINERMAYLEKKDREQVVKLQNQAQQQDQANKHPEQRKPKSGM